MVRAYCNDRRLIWRGAVLAGVLSAASALALPSQAHAGFLDFFFGGFQQRPTPPAGVNSYAEPSAPVAPAARGPESVHQGGGGGGRYVAFCVRLCDGQHFPLERMANATPVEACRSMCPASKTKVFFGSGIDRAVARDGALYAALDTAYLYRDHLVANCTCNGRNAFGLAPLDVRSDPTLRPGDLVSTKNGLLAYTGRRAGQAAEFTPVDPSMLSAEAANSARVRLGRRGAEPAAVADEAPGIIVPPQSRLQGELRGQVDR